MQLVDIETLSPAPVATPPAGWHPSDFAADGPDAARLASRLAAMVPAAPNPMEEKLRKHARLLRQRLDQNTDLAAQQASERLAKAVISAALSTMEAINTELRDVLRVGLVLSSARPGTKRLAFTFTDRLDPRRKVECSLTTALREGEFTLAAECLGRIAEVVRLPLQDGAGENLRTSVETFILESAERFALSAGEPSNKKS